MPSNNAVIPNPGQRLSRLPRSTFKGSVPGFASMNYGRIYPVFMKYQEANSYLEVNPTSLIRGATPITTTMGNAAMELHAFSVPWRIIWNYTKQFFGENDTSAWTQNNEYEKPQIELRVGRVYWSTTETWPVDEQVGTNVSEAKTSTTDLVKVGYGRRNGAGFVYWWIDCHSSDVYGPNKLADYFGIHPIPKNSPEMLAKFFDAQTRKGSNLTISVDALPFRAFFAVVNYYYRDQNYQAPYLYSKDNETLRLTIDNFDEEEGRLRMPYDFMEYRSVGDSDVNEDGDTFEGSAFCPPASRLKDPFSTIVPEPLKGEQYDLLSLAGLAPVVVGTDHALGGGLRFDTDAGLVGDHNLYSYSGTAYAENSTISTGGSSAITQTNLYSDLAQASKITLEKFRDFVVLNQWNEKAVKGTRFAEILNEFYGVPVDPAKLDEPRFLGGITIPINSWQVAQSAPNADGSGVGDLGAFTHTREHSSLSSFFFDEPSIFLVCAVSRVEHTFAQQVDPHWFRKDKFDEHYMIFDGLGYQPMDKRIPYLPFGVLKDNDSTNTENEVLGFQASYWEERFQLGNSAGVLNASNPLSLDYFLYNELPTENPVGTPEFLSAYRDADIVDRTLQLGSEASRYAQQLLVNFSWNYMEAKMISKRMDPGLTRI